MPTADEFRLYERMAGGTGDIEQDAHIARHLQRICNVPEREIASFVRTRDRDTVHKLRAVLKDMPRGQAMTIGGPRAAMRSAGPPKSTFKSPETKLKLQDIASSYRSSYNNGHNGGQPGVRTHPNVFDGIIRNGFHPHLEAWKKQASEDQVRVLADACRSLRNFVTTKGPPTCYKEMFPQYDQVHIKPPPEKNNKKNLSCVPLGCIYAATSAEVEALAGRELAHRTMIADAFQREVDVLDGSALRPDRKHKFPGPSFAEPPQASAEMCLKGDMVDSIHWRSEGKTAWNNDVHSFGNASRFCVVHPRRGATKLRLEGCAADLNHGKPLRGGRGLSQSMPSLSKSA
jgi:hypothetical protein